MPIYQLMTFLWAAFIVIATCTSDAHAFLFEQAIQFNFKTSPNFMELLITSDIHFKEKFYQIQKAGHIISFGVLFVLHFIWMKKLGIAFALTVICAAFSEILQLYFQRNGRLFDIGVDLVGIGLALLVCISIRCQAPSV